MLTVLPIAATQVLSVEQRAQALDAQLERLRDADPLVRQRAAWALGELEHPGAVDALIAALDDDDPRVRTLAAWALGEIKEVRGADALLVAARDDHPRVREMAVLALGELREPDLIGAIRSVTSGDSLRGPVNWALAEIAGTAPEVWAGRLRGASAEPGRLQAHLRILRDGDASARARAAEQLGRLGDPAAVAALLAALADSAPAVRATAVWALDEINPSREDEPTGTRSHPPRD